MQKETGVTNMLAMKMLQQKTKRLCYIYRQTFSIKYFINLATNYLNMKLSYWKRFKRKTNKY